MVGNNNGEKKKKKLHYNEFFLYLSQLYEKYDAVVGNFKINEFKRNSIVSERTMGICSLARIHNNMKKKHEPEWNLANGKKMVATI